MIVWALWGIVVEQSAFATWLRESAWALFALLIVHTLTMGAIVGTALRLLDCDLAVMLRCDAECFYPVTGVTASPKRGGEKIGRAHV